MEDPIENTVTLAGDLPSLEAPKNLALHQNANKSSTSSTDNDDHLDSLQNFIDDLNRTLAGALGQNGRTYERAFCLFIRWEDDVFLVPGVNNGIQGEIDMLEEVLRVDYGFETETFLIPSQNSHRSLQKRVFKFNTDHETRTDLLVVYYGGHGTIDEQNRSIWEQGQGPSVDWYSIQHILEYAVADVAIFLDCCYAASADRRSVDGTIEILAACCQTVKTIGISEWSFTSRLVEVLKASKEKPVTIAMLHAKLVNFRGMEGSKKLLKTPIHSIMSDKERPSIRFCPVISDSTPPLTLSGSDLTQDSSSSTSRISLQDEAPFTRVLVNVAFKNRIQDVEDWQRWLTTHLPPDVVNLKLIEYEGMWGSHSTIFLFSMPIAIWDLLALEPAYKNVAFITTPNILKTNAKSSTNPILWDISRTSPTTFQAYNADLEDSMNLDDKNIDILVPILLTDHNGALFFENLKQDLEAVGQKVSTVSLSGTEARALLFFYGGKKFLVHEKKEIDLLDLTPFQQHHFEFPSRGILTCIAPHSSTDFYDIEEVLGIMDVGQLLILLSNNTGGRDLMASIRASKTKYRRWEKHVDYAQRHGVEIYYGEFPTDGFPLNKILDLYCRRLDTVWNEMAGIPQSMSKFLTPFHKVLDREGRKLKS